jgi:hypothetical protein
MFISIACVHFILFTFPRRRPVLTQAVQVLGGSIGLIVPECELQIRTIVWTV